MRRALAQFSSRPDNLWARGIWLHPPDQGRWRSSPWIRIEVSYNSLQGLSNKNLFNIASIYVQLAHLRESSVLAACQSCSFLRVCFPSGALGLHGLTRKLFIKAGKLMHDTGVVIKIMPPKSLALMSKIVKIMHLSSLIMPKKVHILQQNYYLRQNTVNYDKWLENIQKGSGARKQHDLQQNIHNFCNNGLTCNNKEYTVSRILIQDAAGNEKNNSQYNVWFWKKCILYKNWKIM